MRFTIRDNKYSDLYYNGYDYSIYSKMQDVKDIANELIKHNYHTELIYECERKIFALIESSSCKSGDYYRITDEALEEVISVINNFKNMLDKMEEKMRKQENENIKNYCNTSKKQRKDLNKLIKSMTKDIKELF